MSLTHRSHRPVLPPGPALRGAMAFIMGALCAVPLSAGSVNPDLSVVGQVFGGFTGDPASPDEGEPSLSLGETEILLEAALNPFFKGYFTVAAGEEGFEMEEAYASVLRGLRFGLGLKAGKYRLGFGALNPAHPHAYPFLETPRAWASLLPGGEEGFNDVAVQASILLPTPGDWASTLSVDLLGGGSFHPEQDASRPGWLGRWSHSVELGSKGALEAGISGATGIDDAAGELRGYLGGADLKIKLYLPGSSRLVLQGEGAFRRSHAKVGQFGADGTDGAEAAVPEGTATEEDRSGFYAFADYSHRGRWNLGLLYDQAEREGDPASVDRSLMAFAGLAILEESTVIRLGYRHVLPEGRDGHPVLALQFTFSMGPHKPHRF